MIFELSLLVLIGFFLWKTFSGGGHGYINSLFDESGQSFTQDDNWSSSLSDDDSHSSSSLTSNFDDGPARGMWDITSVYYDMMHIDDPHNFSSNSDDSWLSSSSSSMFDDSFSSCSSSSSFDD